MWHQYPGEVRRDKRYTHEKRVIPHVGENTTTEKEHLGEETLQKQQKRS